MLVDTPDISETLSPAHKKQGNFVSVQRVEAIMAQPIMQTNTHTSIQLTFIYVGIKGHNSQTHHAHIHTSIQLTCIYVGLKVKDITVKPIMHTGMHTFTQAYN